jgi:hypothetical protein
VALQYSLLVMVDHTPDDFTRVARRCSIAPDISEILFKKNG